MSVWERAVSIAYGESDTDLIVVTEAYSMMLKNYFQIKEKDYYNDVRIQLESIVSFQKRFPEILNIGEGSSPQYGENLTIPSAFGGIIGWMDDSPPFIKEYPIKKPEDIDKIIENGTPEPNSGVASRILDMLDYFYDWFPRELRDEYGYVDGVLAPGRCVESAALSMGYDKFFKWMRLYPDLIRKWLKIATDWYIQYCGAIESIVGDCKLLWIPDHTAHMVGKKQFTEFILPYLNKIYNKYPKALRVYHNEGKVDHMLEDINKINAEVWHFGPFDDARRCRNETHFCLQGNLHPPNFLSYTPEEVIQKSKELIESVGLGRFWLSTGGGLAPGTPMRNIDALIQVAKEYSR